MSDLLNIKRLTDLTFSKVDSDADVAEIDAAIAADDAARQKLVTDAAERQYLAPSMDDKWRLRKAEHLANYVAEVEEHLRLSAKHANVLAWRHLPPDEVAALTKDPRNGLPTDWQTRHVIDVMKRK